VNVQYWIGTGANTGIGCGPVRTLIPSVEVDERHIREVQVLAEVRRFDAAVVTTDASIERLGEDERVAKPFGREMVEVHRAILSSPELADETRRLIRERRIGAEWAVRLVVDELRRAFADFEDERFRARFEDVDAVAVRLLDALCEGAVVPIDDRFRGMIAVGLELSPLDAIELHRFGVAGFATEHGGPTSHTAIIARTLGIPYVFGVRGLVAGVLPSEILWIDSTSGEVVANPDAVTARTFELRRKALEDRQHAVEVLKHAPAVTLDGALVSLGANVESAEEVAAAVAGGADHVGLVRTELLYLGALQLPSEDVQYEDALAILHAADGRPVTFRTLDIGDDKLPAGLNVEVGRNPALGLRGIRLSLRRPELFSPQLRALYRAAAEGSMKILLPLVSTVDEVRQARTACAAVCRDLARDGLAHDASVPLGAMIETPSAALTADHIASECDFLSVGTNDLIQYAFAADRQNEEMAFLYQPLHPAILRALDGILQAGRRFQRPVSICGDMAGDPSFTAILLGLGLRSFSMPGRAVPFVKAAVRDTSVAMATDLLAEVLKLTTHDEVVELVQRRIEH
jgi:phosphotransferase system enzyme I (PtsI)